MGGWGRGVWFPETTECAGAGRGGLLVRGDVSVGLSLGGLPWGWGMRRVGHGGDAVRQGSWNQALDGGACSWQPRCDVDQTGRKSETEAEEGPCEELLKTSIQPCNKAPLLPPPSPVGGSVKFWMNSSCLHAGPLRGGHQILLINTVLQAVWDTT